MEHPKVLKFIHLKEESQFKQTFPKWDMVNLQFKECNQICIKANHNMLLECTTSHQCKVYLQIHLECTANLQCKAFQQDNKCIHQITHKDNQQISVEWIDSQ